MWHAVYISDNGAYYWKGLLMQLSSKDEELLINYDWLIGVWGRGLAI